MKWSGLLIPAILIAQGAYEPPAALKLDGVPQIPPELMSELARYNNFRSAGFEDWHPERREMMITTRFANVTQAHRVAMPGGARTQLTFAPERVENVKCHPTNGQTFLYSSDVGGSEFFQLYLFDIATGRSTLLTDGRSRNYGAKWSPDGNWIAYASTRRNRKDSDIYIAEPRAPRRTRIALQVDSTGWGVEDWSPDQKRLLVSRTPSSTESVLYEVDSATGTRTAITPESGANYQGGRYSPDGKSVYLLTDAGSDYVRVGLLNVATRDIATISAPVKWDVTDFALSKNGKRLAYALNEDGASVLHVIDTATRREIAVPRLPFGVLTNMKWHGNGRDLGFDLSSARSPADAYSIDTDAGNLTRWTMSETGGLNAEQFVEPQLIRWKTFDGLNISGYYYKPPARFTGPRPVFVNIHGGPASQFRPSFLSRNNYLLNELGIALIYPNVRGSSGYGNKFLSLDDGKRREDSVKDIGSLLNWIATQPNLDPKRIAVGGGSYGGYMTLASMVRYNDRLRAGIDSVGISNWVTFLENTEAYRRDHRRAEYGDERELSMRDFLSTISPVNNAKKITKPMLVIQGRNDPRVPYTESEQMVRAIRSNNGPVWYVLAADEGHGFRKKANMDYEFGVRVAFLKRFLLEEK